MLAVHERAMQLDGGLELICHQRRVGILDDLSLRHLVACSHNPKEKPVERVFKDITAWEENSFAELRRALSDCQAGSLSPSLRAARAADGGKARN